MLGQKFIHTAGPWREYRGYVFWKDNPVTVSDAATLEAIRKLPEFKRIDHENETQPQATETREVLTQEPDACPKCGKTFQRGLTMHMRFCRGR